MTFHELFIRERKRLGITRSLLARKLGVSRQYIYYLEVGLVNPSLEKLSSFCKFFNIDLIIHPDGSVESTPRKDDPHA